MDDQKSFWTSLPGILTGIGAVIGAVTTLWLALHPTPKPPPVAPSETPSLTKTSIPSAWSLAGEETFTTESPGWKFGSFSTTEEPRFDLRIVDGKYRWDLEYNLGWRDLSFRSIRNGC